MLPSKAWSRWLLPSHLMQVALASSSLVAMLGSAHPSFLGTTGRGGSAEGTMRASQGKGGRGAELPSCFQVAH